MSDYKFDLKNTRQRKNMTQVDLSERSGVSQQAISVYEVGRSFPTLDTAKKLASALGVTVDELIIIKDAKERIAEDLKNLISGEDSET